MDHQQWETVVIRKPVKNKTVKTPQLSESQARTKRLEDETDVPQLQKVSPETRKKIIDGRVSKKLNREGLAKAINEKVAVVKSYEEGSVPPERKVLNKMSRVLGVKL